jgi:hypothetical protein
VWLCSVLLWWQLFEGVVYVRIEPNSVYEYDQAASNKTVITLGEPSCDFLPAME